MYNHGDINASIAKLKIELKQIKYPDLDEFNSKLIAEGDPRAFLPVLHYSVLNYSSTVAKYLLDNGYELFSKSDKDFIEILFRSMINLFNFKVKLSPQQFFKMGFAEGKILYCVEVIRLVRVYHTELNKKNNSLQKLSKMSSKKQIKPISNDNYNKTNNTGDYNNNLPKYTVVNHQTQNRNNEFSMENDDEYERKVPSKVTDKYPSLKEKYFESYNREDHNIIYKDNPQEKEYEEDPYYNEDNENYENDDKQNNYERLIDYQNTHKVNEIQNENDKNNNLTQHSNPENTSMDLKVLTEIIGNLSNSVKEMVRRVDDFKENIETRVNKIEAEVSLIKNRITLLEEEKNHHLTTGREEPNPTTFSFADEGSALKEDQRKEKNRILLLNNANEYNKNQINNRQTVNYGKNSIPEESTKIKEETDIFIDRIASRFKETQRLLNEIK